MQRQTTVRAFREMFRPSTTGASPASAGAFTSSNFMMHFSISGAVCHRDSENGTAWIRGGPTYPPEPETAKTEKTVMVMLRRPCQNGMDQRTWGPIGKPAQAVAPGPLHPFSRPGLG